MLNTKVLIGVGLLAASLMLVGCNKPENNQQADTASSAETKAIDSNDKKLARGKRMFIQCMACHSIGEGQPHKLGPNLFAVVGRPAAALSDFKYSDALAKSELTWDRATLTQWIKQTAQTVPGTTMIYANTLSDAQLDDLLFYMESAQ